MRGRGGGNRDLSRALGLVLLEGGRPLCFPRRTLEQTRKCDTWLRPVEIDGEDLRFAKPKRRPSSRTKPHALGARACAAGRQILACACRKPPVRVRSDD